MSEIQENQTKSSLKGVIFKSIPQSYITGIPIQCQYKVDTWVNVDAQDQVAIYRVAWEASMQPVCMQLAGPLLNGSDGTVTFPGKDLPKEDGDFYQFCYVTKSGNVVGASTPFQFKQKVPAAELVEEEIEDGLMMILPKSEVLQRELGQAMAQEKALQKKMEEMHEMHKTEMQRLLKEQEERKKLFRQDFDKMDKQLKAAVEKCKQLERSVTSQSTVIAELEGSLDELKLERQKQDKEAEQQQKKLQQLQELWRSEKWDLKDELKLMTGLVTTRTGDCRQLEEELAKLRPRYQEKEEEKVRLEGQIEQLKKELGAKVKEAEEYLELMHQTESELGRVDAQRCAFAKEYHRYSVANKEQEMRLKDLTEKENHLQNQLDAVEASKVLMREEIEKMKEDLSASAKMEDRYALVSAQLTEVQANYSNTLQQFQELQKCCRTLTEEKNDWEFNARSAWEFHKKDLESFEIQLRDKDNKIVELQEQKEEAERMMAQLQHVLEMQATDWDTDRTRFVSHVKELKQRLSLAEQSYETLRINFNQKVSKVKSLKEMVKERGLPVSPDGGAKAQAIRSRLKASRGPKPVRKLLVETQTASQCVGQKPPGPQPGKEGGQAHNDKDSGPQIPEELLAACRNIYPNPYISQEIPAAGDNMGEQRAFWAMLECDRPKCDTPPPVRISMGNRKSAAVEKRQQQHQFSEPEEKEFHNARTVPQGRDESLSPVTAQVREQLIASGEICPFCKYSMPETMSRESFHNHVRHCPLRSSQ